MQILLSDTGKRFNREWIFRNLSFEFVSGKRYAITGPNGSGKSTLLQMIGGAISASEGTIQYLIEGKQLDAETIFRQMAIAAPYLELIEEMTLKEFLRFHSQFKPFLKTVEVPGIIARVGLSAAADKQIRYFSSGMKQRVKLAQCIFSNTPCILLDEPCTNLDRDGVEMYQSLVEEYGAGRLIIVSSNDTMEYGFCEELIDMRALKPGSFFTAGNT